MAKRNYLGFIAFGAVLLLSTVLVMLNFGPHREWRRPTEGVSRQLAIFRKGQIADLRYDLSFVIPQKMEQALQGKATICFNLLKWNNVVLDFVASGAAFANETGPAVKGVSVNGRAIKVRYKNEHIIIPKFSLRKGENTVEIAFVPADQSLNRREEFLYTLAVPDRARTIYPCFDQPDMKALFTLTLQLPQGWEAVSNAPLKEPLLAGDNAVVSFEQTKPLSTYLFAFSAGKWQKESRMHKGKSYTAYFRETEPAKLAQLPEIFDLVFKSVDWMENYTGISQPFQKYDFVVVPGFQFGGMEHPGAILYNDKRIFLGANPTVEEQLNRKNLIAHETSHLWFGDAVTMEWFDDVWTKEVFANYFASKMVKDMANAYTEPVVEETSAFGMAENSELLRELRDFYVQAYVEDRTLGTNSIKQPLDNLKDAGLVYGQIIYNKAPIMMKFLVERVGEEAFRQGMQTYLQKYLYGNATWEGLIAILDERSEDDLQQWSEVWVNERGMPQILHKIIDNKLVISQEDPYKRDLVWRQNISVTILDRNNPARRIAIIDRIALEKAKVEVSLSPEIAETTPLVLMNVPGGAYGQILYETEEAEYILNHFESLPLTKDQKLALLIDLNENRLLYRVNNEVFAKAIRAHLQSETEPLILSLECSYLRDIALRWPEGSKPIEEALLALAPSRPVACGQTAFRTLLGIFTTPEIAQEIYRIWKSQEPYKDLILSETDYMKMAYELAIRWPEKYAELLQVQLERISNPDRRSEFQFVARAVNPDKSYRDSLFHSLMQPENRRIEPWTVQVLGYLNHPLRQREALPYILPALQELQEVQKTGDIFFPKNWCAALLQGHNSAEAKQIVADFLHSNPNYPPLLANKILQSAHHLMRGD